MKRVFTSYILSEWRTYRDIKALISEELLEISNFCFVFLNVLKVDTEWAVMHSRWPFLVFDYWTASGI
jgi:hypothetical protein